MNVPLKYQKANKTFSEIYRVADENGKVKEHEEIISLGTTDLKVNLTLQKINFHSRSIGVKLDNRAVQLRPNISEIREFQRKEKNYR